MRRAHEEFREELQEIADKEVTKLSTVMQELQRAIREELERKDGPQLLLNLGGDERAQRERDMSALRRRLNEIPAEIERESAHLRDRYKESERTAFPGRCNISHPPEACARAHEGPLMSVARHHADWLSLLEISGPFVSMPVLMRVFSARP